ncbi:MAG: translation initiation factor IF-2 subunit beta [Candidatus Nanohalarchaeota archaeon]|nr:MAG: translation initiation factor IF-2 subunit beta [Candidatus Nanohaloarchaeota archaeon]
MDEYEKFLKRAQDKLPKDRLNKDRFVMPKLSSFIEGNKTVIKNIDDIAKTIRRDANHLIKFMAAELASQGVRSGMIITFIGKFPNSLANKKLEKYVVMFVLCPTCKKPDTTIIKIGRISFIKCEACGAKNPIV